jgi:protein-tyrosine phosphatase
VLTPHQRHDRWENRERSGDLEALRQKVEEGLARIAGDGPQLLLGAEIRVDSELLNELDDPAAHGLLPLAGTRYLLLEMDRYELRPDPLHLAHELRLSGWRPIFAHPELIRGLGEDLDLMAHLQAEGALFQITAMSVTGEFGQRPREVSHRLLDAGLVHFLASDCHGADRRPPGLTRARREVAQRWGEEVARALTEDHPRAVVADQPLHVAAEEWRA